MSANISTAIRAAVAARLATATPAAAPVAPAAAPSPVAHFIPSVMLAEMVVGAGQNAAMVANAIVETAAQILIECPDASDADIRDAFLPLFAEGYGEAWTLGTRGAYKDRPCFAEDKAGKSAFSRYLAQLREAIAAFCADPDVDADDEGTDAIVEPTAEMLKLAAALVKLTLAQTTDRKAAKALASKAVAQAFTAAK